MESKSKPTEPTSNGEDVPDVYPSSWPHSGKDGGITRSPVAKEALFYNMNHKRRGIAVIFNHENFDISSLKPRTGTNEDCENLKATLKLLGFEVATYYDLKSSEVEEITTKVSKQDHADCDCFVLVLLSHGEQGIIYSRDSAYKPDTLWSKFTPDLCPTLAGKPKLFFIQACQGDRLDGGVRLTQVDGSPSYRIPIHADFCIAYSTIPGFYSWRNTSRGSWFIQALCLEIRENGFNYDLLTLLTFVNRRVAVDFESCVPNDYRMNAQKQIPCITFMLTRLLKFTKKPDMV